MLVFMNKISFIIMMRQSFLFIASVIICCDARFIDSSSVMLKRYLNHSESCLGSKSVQIPKRNLKYADFTESPVLLPYMRGLSGQILADIAYILLTEVMGYRAMLFDLNSDQSADFVGYLGGCVGNSGNNCSEVGFEHPSVHFSLETWADGINLVKKLPKNVQPTLSGMQEYTVDEGFYLRANTYQACLKRRVWLDDYHFYDADAYSPHEFFDPLDRLIEFLPLQQRSRCTDVFQQGAEQQAATAEYFKVSNDTAQCQYNDTVWIAPACRLNESECVPLLLQSGLGSAMQIAYFWNMPLAIITVDARRDPDSSSFRAAVGRGNFLFQWRAPSSGDPPASWGASPPIAVQLPRPDLDEQAFGLFRTGRNSLHPQIYAWARLKAVDPAVALLASRLALDDSDLRALRAGARGLPAGGGGGGGGGGGIPDAAAFELACGWVRDNPDRWRQWVSVACPPGSFADDAAAECPACPAGRFCPGGRDPPQPAPADYYSAGNASAPSPCPPGRSTPGPGAASADNCTLCAAGYVPAASACVSFRELAVAVFAPLLAAALAAAAAAARWLALRDEATWRIQEGDVRLADPPDVLGRGSQGVVCRGTLRGTPVAVKRLSAGPPQRPVGSGGGSDSGDERGWGAGASPPPMLAAAGGLLRLPVMGAGSLPSVGRTLGQLRRDVRALVELRHPRIVTVLGVTEMAVEGDRGPCLVMELMELGSLWDLLHSPTFPLDAGTALGFLEGVAEGMLFLHSAAPPMLHCDLKARPPRA